MKVKFWGNFINIFNTLSWNDFLDYKPPKDSLSNLTNTNMNNVGAIDYMNSDWT